MAQKNHCSHCGKEISRTAMRCKSCALLGNTRLAGHIPTEATRLKLSISHRGKVHTEETKNKITASKVGERNPNWNGGRANIRGYVQVLCPEHPAASNNGYVPEHRLVMEAMLGRYLRPEEVVHHKDGNRANNEQSNLTLFPNPSAHIIFHANQKSARAEA